MEFTNLNSGRKKRGVGNLELGTMLYGKVPPQAKDLEAAVLGAVMIERKAFMDVNDILKPHYFYVDAHNRIFKACIALNQKNSPIDLLTVIEELKFREELDLVGGPYFVTKLTNEVVSSANIRTHAYIIVQKFVAREVIRLSGESIGNAYEDSSDPFDLLDKNANDLKDLRMEIEESKNILIPNITVQIITSLGNKVHNARNDIEDPNIVLTGMKEWDRINGSLGPGFVYVVAARPGMGKGVHMTQCLCNMGKRYQIGVINGEMTNAQLLTRVACNLGNIDNYLWKKNANTITDEELTQLNDAMELVQGMNLHIDNSCEIGKACNKIKLWKERYDIQVVFMDVLSKFTPPEDIAYRMTDVQKINYVMAAIVRCAIEAEIPIVLYAHINREIYKTGNREPNMSHLKGSGIIEDFAFQVSLLHRPEYYDISEDEDGETTKGLSYQVVVKHRDGETGKIKNRFLPQFSQMAEWVNEVKATGWTPGWKPMSIEGDDTKLYIHKGSKMMDGEFDDETPF